MMSADFIWRLAMKLIAEVEGPVHLDLIHQRSRDAWAIGRIGPRVRENIAAAIEVASLVRDGDFVDIADRPVRHVRTPTEEVKRTAQQVPVGEMNLAITHLLRDSGNTLRTELVTAVARLFGWNRTGTGIDRRVSVAIDNLIDENLVTQVGSQISLT